MIKRFLVMTAALIIFYIGIIQLQLFLSERREARGGSAVPGPEIEDPFHRVYSFSFSKYTTAGDKEIEIEGDSADVFARNVILKNVIAKAYAEESPVTITADTGEIDKATSRVRLEKNVVATTETGTRLLTEALDIFPAKKILDTALEAEVKRDNINVEGTGAQGDSRLKKVKFKKNVTVIVKNPESESKTPTVITCDGPLVVNYDENLARFTENVLAVDERGKIRADVMDVYYNKETRRVSKMVAMGNVVVDNPDGHQTLSDNVIYLAEEGRIILGGDAEALYKEGTKSVETGF
ncbi:MAG: LPS export ABC transporter periplasmic protein LptC [Candidatus Omnitrophica bacterium]|nr:LPS export ABC transporter periplasmic protein LptC [Candidatus Omnitrophota bacterium]